MCITPKMADILLLSLEPPPLMEPKIRVILNPPLYEVAQSHLEIPDLRNGLGSGFLRVLEVIFQGFDTPLTHFFISSFPRSANMDMDHGISLI